MKDIWQKADMARETGFAVEDMLHGAFRGWVDRAEEAWTADGMRPEGRDYHDLGSAMMIMSSVRIEDALHRPEQSVEQAASMFEANLKAAYALLEALHDRMDAAGHGHAARLAAELASAAAEALAML